MTVSLKLDRADYSLGDTIRASVTVSGAGNLPAPEFCQSGVSFRLSRNSAAGQSILTRVGPRPAAKALAAGQNLEATIELIALEPGALKLEALYNPRTLDFQGAETSSPVAFTVKPGKKLHVRLTTEAGPIMLEFFPERAHNHVLSFVQLAAKGYFNGISFHRIVPGFVIQGGDPTGSGSGGPGYKIPAEFNDYPHDLGVLSMARTSDPHSAGSQFFVCLSRERTAGLDNQYTVFGKVVSGIEAVQKIGADESNAKRYHMQKAEVVIA
jgi:cyclophilin family peptidyl-prolyl cis-trans isomerase